MDQKRINLLIQNKNHFLPSGMHLASLKDQDNAKNLEGVDFHLKLANKRGKGLGYKIIFHPCHATHNQHVKWKGETCIIELIKFVLFSYFVLLMKNDTRVGGGK